MKTIFAQSLQSTSLLLALAVVAFLAGRYAGNHSPPGPLRYLVGGAVLAIVFIGGFLAMHRLMPNF